MCDEEDERKKNDDDNGNAHTYRKTMEIDYTYTHF